MALFISHYAPRWIAQPLAYIIDLLAAIPSVIYGLWGIAVLGPASVAIQEWLGDHVSWIPFFKGPASATGRTMLVAGLVLAVMILPIITAVARAVFVQTPRKLQEAALALGATRWEMIRMTVLPFGKSAMISASMLGLGRALGETMAVAIVLSVSGDVTLQPDQLGEPVDDRGPYRARLPRVLGPRRQRADRLRPRAVRRDARDQHGGARRHQPRSPVLMSTHVPGERQEREQQQQPPQAPPPPAAQTAVEPEPRPPAPVSAGRAAALTTKGSLPHWAPWAVIVGSAVAVGAVLAAIGFKIALLLIFTAILSGVVIYVWSRAVEGRSRRHRPRRDVPGRGRVPDRGRAADLTPLHGRQARHRPLRRRLLLGSRCAASSAPAAARTTRSSAR